MMGIDSSFDELFWIIGIVAFEDVIGRLSPRIGELTESSSDDKETSDFGLCFFESSSAFIFQTQL